jgi:hypothetical protein
MEQGVAGVVDVSKLSRSRSGRYEFICAESQLHGDQIHGYIDKIEDTCEKRISTFGQTPSIFGLLKDWQSFLDGRGPNPVPPGDALYAIMVCEASVLSSANECWVTV